MVQEQVLGRLILGLTSVPGTPVRIIRACPSSLQHYRSPTALSDDAVPHMLDLSAPLILERTADHGVMAPARHLKEKPRSFRAERG